ncbi:MAG TPA: hypothetical protein VG321_09255 [Solirubrobacteraceae bacterium]|nr:hypothetical protein [Solirubrobacteraceae bacterium]
MYSWSIKRLVAFLYGCVSRGQLRLPLLTLAGDARLVFPGESSFGGEHSGKPAVETWMRRFASLHPQFTTHDASAAGPPWNMRVFMRFSDRIVAPDGYIYENEGLEYIRIRWGLIQEIRVSLDTEKVAALDRHLPPTAA